MSLSGVRVSWRLPQSAERVGSNGSGPSVESPQPWIQPLARDRRERRDRLLLDSAGNVIGVVSSTLRATHAAGITGDIPQNVNFAIKGAVVRSFLDIHGVAYNRRPSSAKLAPEQLAELARTFTVAVHCWE